VRAATGNRPGVSRVHSQQQQQQLRHWSSYYRPPHVSTGSALHADRRPGGLLIATWTDRPPARLATSLATRSSPTKTASPASVRLCDRNANKNDLHAPSNSYAPASVVYRQSACLPQAKSVSPVSYLYMSAGQQTTAASALERINYMQLNSQ